MRIAFIHPYLYRYPRGIERYTISLANTLTNEGAEVHILTWRWANPVQVEPLDPRVRVHCIRVSRYFSAKSAVPYYIWDLVRHRYDFVWIFFADYGEGEALALVRRQRFGIVLHYPYTLVPHRYREFQRYGLAQRAGQIVSVSQFVADGVRKSLNRESVVIRHGVDSKHFAPYPAARIQVREQLGLKPDTPLLVTAAALEERKGIQWVLRALPQVIRHFPETVYMIVGDGWYRASLEKLASELNVLTHVRFLGAQANAVPYYQAADLSIILAHGEASSLFALESLACETPLISSCNPPFDEIIQPAFGFMVDEHNSAQVADTIVHLLGDPLERAKLGRAGRSAMIRDYSWERAGEEYMRLLE